MKYVACIGMIMFGWATLTGCVVDEPTTEPNSAQGHLFVDLDKPLAVEWDSEVLLFGPPTGDEHCDDELGCYSDHYDIEMHDVVSSDPSVVEVRNVAVESYGQVEAVRLDLRGVATGETQLEFVFSVDGDYSPDDEDDGDESTDGETEDQSENAETEQQEQPQRFVDSFPVESRNVSSVRLARPVEDVDPDGDYAQCPRSGPGLYMMRHIDEYAVQLGLEKIDDRGELLRGSGQIPFDIEPEDAVEIEEIEDAPGLVKLTPQQFGHVEMTPTQAGVPFEAHFVHTGAVSTMDTRLYLLTEHGGRQGEASVMIVDEFYEVEVAPSLTVDAPLCGGAMESTVESRTPAICEVAGPAQTTGNPVVIAGHGGQCHLRVTLEGAAGGHGLEEDYRYSVEYDW